MSDGKFFRRDFDVLGAGTLRVELFPFYCGGKEGPSIGVSWGRYGYTGGLITDAELQRLRDEIDLYFEQKESRRIKPGQPAETAQKNRRALLTRRRIGV